MIIKAADVIFTGNDGEETNLIVYMHRLADTLQVLRGNAKCIMDALEDLNDRLTALETRKVNKPH